MVAQMFPETPIKNIEMHLPNVLSALADAQIATREMILMALATIRAEVACFEPISERESPLNTSPGGQPFDLYDHRSDLGNLGPHDGQNFRGRGFVQLTGRRNYQLHGHLIGLGDLLTTNPDIACESVTAAKLLASFLKLNAQRITTALGANNLAKARTCVNGGSNGTAEFIEAYNSGVHVLPKEIDIVPA